MKKVKSLKTLIRFCQRNGIWSFSPLPHLEGHVMRWTLMYGLIDGDACRAEFVSRPAGGGIPCGVKALAARFYSTAASFYTYPPFALSFLPAVWYIFFDLWLNRNCSITRILE